MSLVGAIAVISDGGRDSEEFAPLLVPVAGPFIAAGTARDATAMMVLDGITQTVGVGLTILGAVATEPILVRNYEPPETAKPEIFIGPRAASVRFRF